MTYYGITDKEHYLAHAGKKGMKWGYTDGVKNGKRTAEEIEEALNQLKAKLQNGAEDISEKAEAVKEAAKKKVEDISNKAKDLVTNVKTATVKEITEAANKGRAAIDRLMTREKKVTVSEHLSSKSSSGHKDDSRLVFNVNDREFKKRARENNTFKPDIVFNVSDPEFKKRAKENNTLKPDIVFDVTDRSPKKWTKKSKNTKATISEYLDMQRRHAKVAKAKNVARPSNSKTLR